MLPKTARLNLKLDFKRVAVGKKLEGKFLKLFILKTGLQPKVGIALSSKNFKKAYQRNRARRLTSKAFEQLYPVLPPADIIALPKAGILEIKSGEVVGDLNEILNS